MLILRSSQIEQLALAPREEFQVTAYNHLVACYPGIRGVPRSEVLKAFKPVIEGGWKHGFQTEEEMLVFVMAAYLLGADFDREHDGIREALGSPEYGPAEKARYIQAYVNSLVEQTA